MASRYDAIMVGARCAGSPIAMLLARKGHRVLVVDRATFPSDTVSTHLIHPPGMAVLNRWGAPRPGGGHRMPANPHLRV
jgi:2-polyprenyl-6-methoxyphenol hydroxylase-like FAD-dependent oxidoreductase